MSYISFTNMKLNKKKLQELIVRGFSDYLFENDLKQDKTLRHIGINPDTFRKYKRGLRQSLPCYSMLKLIALLNISLTEIVSK